MSLSVAPRPIVNFAEFLTIVKVFASGHPDLGDAGGGRRAWHLHGREELPSKPSVDSDDSWSGRVQVPLVLKQAAGESAECRSRLRSAPLSPHVQDLKVLLGHVLFQMLRDKINGVD